MRKNVMLAIVALFTAFVLFCIAKTAYAMPTADTDSVKAEEPYELEVTETVEYIDIEDDESIYVDESTDYAICETETEEETVSNDMCSCDEVEYVGTDSDGWEIYQCVHCGALSYLCPDDYIDFSDV